MAFSIAILHFRVLRIAGKAHIGAGRRTINTRQCHPASRIDARLASRVSICQYAHGVVGGVEYSRNAVPARCPRQRCHAAEYRQADNAANRHGAFRFIGILHHRYPSSVCAPTSSSCLICTGSFHDGRTTGWLGPGAIACNWVNTVCALFGACSPSISNQSAGARWHDSAL